MTKWNFGCRQLGNFSFKSLKDYEAAVDSVLTIVSDLNEAQFAEFQNKIDAVAKQSGKSSVEVAQAFEKIAGLNAAFASSASGIGQVTEATITLAKAARMDLGVAAENLVGIMNQFSFGADQANRTINALAAGQAVGAASISQTAEAFTIFGSVAKGSNITLEQSVGLIQTLGKFSIFGAEAGTKLRGAVLRLQKAGVGYASGQFNIVDALTQTNAALSKLQTAKQKDQIINKLFGAENVSVGRTLLSNIDTLQKFTRDVTGTTEAQKAAAINSDNLKTAVEELGAAWVNMITGTDNAKKATSELTNATRFLTENLSTIVETTITAVKWYAIIKGSLFAARAAMTAWNVTLGISAALQGTTSTIMASNTVALAAQSTALSVLGVSLKGATVSQLSLNAAMAANPVGMIVLGLTALAGTIYLVSKANDALNERYKERRKIEVAGMLKEEKKELIDLIQYYFGLGMSMREATVEAIRFKKAQVDLARLETRAEISSASRDVAGMKVSGFGGARGGFGSALVNMFAGNSGAANRLLEAQKRDHELARKNRMYTEFAQSQIGGQISKEDLGGIFNTKKTPQRNFQSPFGKAMDATAFAEKWTFAANPAPSKSEVTITVKNDGDSTLSISHGKTKIADVMPKTESTKTLIGGR